MAAASEVHGAQLELKDLAEVLLMRTVEGPGGSLQRCLSRSTARRLRLRPEGLSDDQVFLVLLMNGTLGSGLLRAERGNVPKLET